ncbi:MAG: class I SAM-dependent methyltransferase [Rhodospirillaceae bacterium]|nr:class I SAM-dependent methyltransferase [Rhodospirillaceae bacterium]
MAKQPLQVSERLYSYILEFGFRDDPLLQELRAETSKLPASMMQISPEQGQFMALLAQLMGVRRAIEIGTFTGYSSLSVARALPADGKLICCDVSEEYTAVARRYWAKAGVAGKIDLRLAPALDTLAALKKSAPGSFDMAFIDADKTNYPHYYEAVLDLLRPGGVVLIDNVLWGGDVADPASQDLETTTLRKLNSFIAADARVDFCLLPIADGLTIARKR